MKLNTSPRCSSLLFALLFGALLCMPSTSLGQEADSTLVALTADLRDTDDFKSKYAAARLLALDSDTAEAVLRAAIDGDDGVVSQRVLDALGSCWGESPRRAVRLLIVGLDSEFDPSREAACGSLRKTVDLDSNRVKIGYNQVVLDGLFELIAARSAPSRARLLALQVLREVYSDSMLTPKNVVAPLIAALDGERSEVVDGVNRFLYEMTGQDLLKQQAWQEWWALNQDRPQADWFRVRLDRALDAEQRALDESVKLWERLLIALRGQEADYQQALREALQHSESRIKRLGIQEVGRRALETGQHEKAVKDLVPFLKDPNRQVRLLATAQLKALRHHLATMPLLEVLDNPKTFAELRLQALEALGEIGDTLAVRSLVDIVRQRKPEPLVVPALVALGKVRYAGDSCALVVCAYLEAELAKPEVSRATRGVERGVECLGNLRFESYRREESLAVQVLTGPVIAEATPYNRRSAVEHLKRFPHRQAVDCLIGLLEDVTDPRNDEALRAQAVVSLGSIAAGKPNERAEIVGVLLQTALQAGKVSEESLRFLKVLVKEDQKHSHYTTLRSAIDNFRTNAREDFVVAVYDALKLEEPSDPEARELYLGLLKDKAETLCKAEKFDAARALFEHLGTPARLGECLLAMARWDEAEQVFRELLTLPDADLARLWSQRLDVQQARIEGEDPQWVERGSALLAELNGAETSLPEELQARVDALRTRIAEVEP